MTEIPTFWLNSPAPKQLVSNLFNGPDDVRALLLRITEEESRQIDMPAWVAGAVRGLRPLSRKFLARVFEQGDSPCSILRGRGPWGSSGTGSP